MPDELRQAAADPEFEAWRKNSVAAAQEPGLFDRHDLAEADRRARRWLPPPAPG